MALSDAAARLFITVSNIPAADGTTENRSQAVTRTWQYEENALPGRTLSVTEQTADGTSLITERFVYAGNTEREKALNLAGQCIHHYDTAGLVQMDSISIAGVPLSVTRRLLKSVDNPDAPADWQGADTSAWNALLSAEAYTSLSSTDAIGTVLNSTDAAGNLQRMTYDVAGQLRNSWLAVNGQEERVIVKSLTYSAAGHKLCEVHGNGVVITCTRDPETQLLTGIKTERPASHVLGAKVLQDLHYRYDPVGKMYSASAMMPGRPVSGAIRK